MQEIINPDEPGAHVVRYTTLSRRIHRLEGRIDRMETNRNNRLNEMQIDLGRHIDKKINDTFDRIETKLDQLNNHMDRMSDSIGNLYKWMFALILPLWVMLGMVLIKLFSSC